MSRVDEIYLSIVDEVIEKLNKYNFETRDELREKIEMIRDELLWQVESAFDEIEEDYAKEIGLEWEEDI